MKIGIIGSKNVGKDTIANILERNFLFKKVAFADIIKQEFYKLSGYTEIQFKSSRGTDLEARIRNGLWDYSKNMKDLHGDDYFIKPVLNSLHIYENIVITDVRTKLEFKSIQKHVIFIHIYRNNNFTNIEDSELCVEDVAGCLKFCNNYNNLADLERNFIEFYLNIKEKGMDPDSKT